MTTCRSSVLLLALATTATGIVPVALAQAPARPATHTVQRGDTLWDLSRRYLGDPYLWPQIYRLNTGIVADPHWIFPGQVLTLVAGEGTQAVPADPAGPAPPAAAAPATPAARAADPVAGEELFPRRRAVDASAALEAYRDRTYRALRPGEFYSSGFLTEADDLPFGQFLGNVTPSQIPVGNTRSFTLLNDRVAIRPPNGARYAVGDSLLVVRLGPGPSGQREWGHVVHPTGLLVVTGHEGANTLARVQLIFGEMRDGQLVLPAERFVSSGEARAVPVERGVSGRIILSREEHPMRHPMDVLFLDVGRRDGVAAGDLFEVRREPAGSASDRSVGEVMATLQVVHVRERSATARLLTVTSPDFPPRALVQQVARLPR
jgi:hypothetical protein